MDDRKYLFKPKSLVVLVPAKDQCKDRVLLLQPSPVATFPSVDYFFSCLLHWLNNAETKVLSPGKGATVSHVKKLCAPRFPSQTCWFPSINLKNRLQKDRPKTHSLSLVWLSVYIYVTGKGDLKELREFWRNLTRPSIFQKSEQAFIHVSASTACYQSLHFM